MFEIFAKDSLIGHSALEHGDAPMGVAFGIFRPAEGYRQIQRACQANHDQSRLALSARTPEGLPIPCEGVNIMDVSHEFEDGDPGNIEVSVLGIPYPCYEELFPGHVADYQKRFGDL